MLLRPRLGVLLAALLVTTSAAAGPYDGFRLGVLGSFGFGGKTETKQPGLPSARSDNQATVGFVLNGAYPLWNYLSLGLEFGVLFTKTDAQDRADFRRNTVLDIAPVVEGKFPLLGGRLEPFLKLPFGLSIFVPGKDADDAGYRTGVGWTVGLMGGARYFVWRGLAVEAEMGWQGHGGSYDFEDPQGGQKVEIDYEGHQFQLRFGLLWGF